MKKKDFQFFGIMLVAFGAILAVASQSISFNPLNQGGIASLIALAGIAVFWYGIRE